VSQSAPYNANRRPADETKDYPLIGHLAVSGWLSCARLGSRKRITQSAAQLRPLRHASQRCPGHGCPGHLPAHPWVYTCRTPAVHPPYTLWLLPSVHRCATPPCVTKDWSIRGVSGLSARNVGYSLPDPTSTDNCGHSVHCTSGYTFGTVYTVWYITAERAHQSGRHRSGHRQTDTCRTPLYTVYFCTLWPEL